MKCSVLIGLTVLFAGCQSHDRMEILVDNPSELARYGNVMEISADSVLGSLGSKYCYVTDAAGNEIPSQITHDSRLIFSVSPSDKESVAYYVLPSDTVHTYDAVVAGRLYPERADDVAWENDKVGFRIYGPATQAKGEKSYGYDIFFKYQDKGLVLERLYEPETNPATWVKRDSLAAIDPKLAEDFVKTISYHLDHGLGMDCYAVGSTLGDGVAAILDNDTISYPWCYEKAEILDNGPLRFTVSLDFAPRVIGNDTVTEHRIVSLDAGAHLNRCSVWYDGLSTDRELVVGFPLRDDTAVMADKELGVLAYADPTQSPDNGKALLGIVADTPATDTMERDGHALLKFNITPGEPFTYRWGFAWDRTDINDLESWMDYLKAVAVSQ